MRSGLILGCLLMLMDGVICSAKPQQTHRNAKPVVSSVQAILREASAVALKQGAEESYWTGLALLDIGDMQIRAGDFDGALRSIRGSSDTYRREDGLLHLAEALAYAGKRERAFDILRLQDTGDSRQKRNWQDAVQLRWIEHLVALGDLKLAGKAIEQIKSKECRADGLRKLAVAYAQSGDATRAKEHFAQATAVAALIKGEFFRAQSLWETADAQLKVGEGDAAKETIQRIVKIVEGGEFKDTWAKVSALREAAVLAAKAKDEQTAHRLFDRAIEARKALDTWNQVRALVYIAEAQAGVGFLDDALKTASMIEHDPNDFTLDGEREQALYAIAVAQTEADDCETAVGTALSIKYYTQYRDDALDKIVERHIAKKNLRAALAASDKFANPSRKATAILKVATAYARSGARKTAAKIAARIQLTPRDRLLTIAKDHGFDYRIPRSWSVCYDASSAFTMLSYSASIHRTAEVAAAAMALWQTLGQKPTQSYAVLFKEIYLEEVVRSLARAHAALGDPDEALAWARQIGSGVKADSNTNFHTSKAVQIRVQALLGVAEGILDRHKPVRSNPSVIRSAFCPSATRESLSLPRNGVCCPFASPQRAFQVSAQALR